MKLLLLAVFAIAAACALPVEQTQEPADGWYVPQNDGTLEWMSKEDWARLEHEHIPANRKAATVRFFLYTDDNMDEPQEIITDNTASLRRSNFDAAVPTRIIVHGWQNNAESDVCILLRDALLESDSYNVICVDWSDKAETINYPGSVLRVPQVGRRVAEFIDFLNEAGDMAFETLFVMGHSLGAHVCGHAGKNVQNGRIQQITGLDTALPLFSYDSEDMRLNADDAEYVESVHTCGGMLGFLQPIGGGAFYPNGGKAQPGCGLDVTGSCAHSRAYEYYAEALRANSFPSVPCSSYQDAVSKNCGNSYSSIKMGSPTNHIHVDGEYFVPVNKKAPFGMAS